MTSPSYPYPLNVAFTQKSQQQLLAERAGVLAPWYTALANRHYATANIVFIGDSQVEGTNLTNYYQRVSQRTVEKLRELNPTNGVITGGRGYIKTSQTQAQEGFGSTGITDYPCTITGSPGALPGWGAQFDTTGLQNPGTAITASFALIGDKAKIMWLQNTLGGHFTWQVDGGSATTVNTAGGSNLDGQSTTVNMGTAGAHTLLLSGVDNGFNAYVAGVVEYNGDSTTGIQMHECGHFGYSAASWIAQTSSTQWPAAIAALSPNVVIINLSTNDAITVGPAQYQTNMTSLIAAIRSGLSQPFPPIVLSYFGSRGDVGLLAPWVQYVAAGWNIANTDTGGYGGLSGVTVHDMTLPNPGTVWQRMENAPGSLGLWNADKIHPSSKGHSTLADSLSQFLMPW